MIFDSEKNCNFAALKEGQKHYDNMKKNLLMVALCLFISIKAMPQTMFQHPWQGKRVAYLGDSITDPRNKGAQKKYWGWLQDWLQITLQTVRNSGVPVKEGAEEILPLLRGHGLKTGLCTNNTRTVVMEYLRLLGWTHRFDVIITAEDVKRRKPFPDTYLLAAQRLQVQPVNCIGVEDSPSGLLSVHAAHMHSVCIPDLIPIPDEIPTNATLSSLLLLPDYLHQRHQF